MTFDSTAYFKEVSTKLKEIGHIDNDSANKRFYKASSTANLEEIINNITIIDGLMLVSEDNLEGSVIENRSGATFDRQLCSFFLLKKAKVLNEQSRNQILAEMEAALTKIIGKMRRDYYTDNEGTINIGLRNIEWNSLSYFTFGPVLDSMFGLHFSFTVLYQVKFSYNENDWIS